MKDLMKKCLLGNKLLVLLMLAGTMVSAQGKVNDATGSKNERKQQQKMTAFVDKLMSQMTVEEKIGQLNLLPASDITTGNAQSHPLLEMARKGQLGAVLNLKGVDRIRLLQEAAVSGSRLGIPLLIGMDVIHGYETIFPIPLALSCSWDTAAIEQCARIAAKEASADGINWTFSPMVDIARDARWGRIAEGSGEDAFLGSRIAEALVHGYQGTGNAYSIEKDHVMACVKHYGLYGGAEAGRDYNTVDMSRLRMYNYYFPPYKAAAQAGAGSFMSSFNVVDYVPATANRWLLTDVLRDEWGFGGFVVTDYGSIGEMQTHGLGNLQQSSARALQAGTDMDMCSSGFSKTLQQSLEEGKVSMADIDRACRRILEAKYKLGLFSDPYRYCDATRRATDIYTAEHRQAARELAAETFVLLKNEGGVLPLKKQGTIALIGPLADSKDNMPGCWSPTATYQYETLREYWAHELDGQVRLLYAQGCNICRDAAVQENGSFGHGIPRIDDAQGREEALRIASEADVIVCAMGELAEMSGEAASRSRLELFDVQRELLEALTALGKPLVLLNYSGRPTVMTWESEHIPAIMNVWFAGSEGAAAITDVLFGTKSPSGRLTTSLPQTTGQVPIFYNHLNTGRPVKEGTRNYRKYVSNYLDVPNDPLYAFGYGLSYTSFIYSDFTLSSPTMNSNGTVTASVTVSNSGNYDADEVVQLYIRDVACSIARPVKELKGFQRIHLKKGESRRVDFTITPELLMFYNSDLQYVLEPGDFDIMVGPDSREQSLSKATLTVM